MDPDEEHTVAEDAHEQDPPTEPTPPAPAAAEPPRSETEPPTEPAARAAAAEEGGPATPPAPAAAKLDEGGPVTPPAPAAAEPPRSEPGRARSKAVVAVVLVLVLGVGGGFLLGRATAPDEGPTSLADAVSQTAKGDLPVGQVDLQKLLQSIGEQKGGALGKILGSNSGKGSDLLGGLLGDLFDNLRNRIEHGAGSSSGSSSSAVLGVQAQAAPAGQTGVLVQEVVPGSAAADAGLQANDVITAVDGTAVTSPAQLTKVVQSHDPGDQVTIAYTRAGTSTTVKVRLGNGASSTTTPTTAPTTTPPTTQAPTSA